MQDYEKLGAFYLGKEVDAEKGGVTDSLLLYDSKDLTTHAVCVGMTGSGKTGLCIGLLEEAAIDGIPALIIDPKGDLGNLTLAFPNLQPSDFRPWVDPDEAARQGISVDDFAAKTATSWKQGLASWGQEPARIARYRDSVDIAIYTPGSTAGIPLSILQSLAVPSSEVLADADTYRDRIVACVSGLLGLAGITADPVKSREHILLSTILDQAWKAGRRVDIAGLITAIQSPPFSKVGVFDVDTFFPAKDRLDLAMALNNLLAAPGFSTWMEGEPLDIQRLLFTPQGKPRLSIISIAHLSDSERMFVVTLILNEMISWMRSQSGTSSLRALLYMDEIFGYFPPSAVPPSKMPMLTLLKQARAFGVGVVLATQNPVDLDYKGLSNTGTWLIGRLQTDRDKARVMDGLESATPNGFNRQKIEAMLNQTGKRTFLLHNVHEDHPVLFQSRWTLSYLRGPMTSRQIQSVMAGRQAAAPVVAVTPRVVAPEAGVPLVSAPAATDPGRPSVPAGIQEYFVCGAKPGDSYQAGIVGIVKLHFVDAKTDVDLWTTSVQVVPLAPDAAEPAWDSARTLAGNQDELDTEPMPGAKFGEFPSAASRARNFDLWAKTLKTWIYQGVTMDLLACPDLKAVARPGESEGDFRARLGQVIREQRDAEVEKLRRSYAPKLATVQEQLRKAEARVEAEKSQMGQQAIQTAISIGATVLGALFGRKMMTAGNLGRAATAMRGAGRTMRERGDITRAGETVEVIKARLDELQQAFEQEAAKLQQAYDPASLKLESVHIRPRKTDITVTSVGLAWLT